MYEGCRCSVVRTYIVNIWGVWFANCIDFGVTAKAGSLQEALDALCDKASKKQAETKKWAPESLSDIFGVTATYIEVPSIWETGPSKLTLVEGYPRYMTPIHHRRPRLLLDSVPAWQVFKYNLIGLLAKAGLIKAQLFKDNF